jgi:hypothetical protein
MIKQILVPMSFMMSFFTSCKENINQKMTDVEVWQLGWRVVASFHQKNYVLANLQFDSLRNNTDTMDTAHLMSGLNVKSELGKNDEISEILSSLDQSILQDICSERLLSKHEICQGHLHEEVENRKLQMELIKMYILDQAARGTIMQDLISKYRIDSTEISQLNMIDVGKQNTMGLKKIIGEFGFPTRKLVGKDAMYGVFLIIQHSDHDSKWQKSQLTNIKRAVTNGDLKAQSYAYLYDRIKIRSGEKQLYGTQLANADIVSKTVELAETADMENLDKRRMEMGLMPINMYKEIMLTAIR